MDLASIDQLLMTWDERLRLVDENWAALEGDVTYQRLSNPGGARARLDGVTRARVYPALDALDALGAHRELLTHVLARAKVIRGSTAPSTVGLADEEERVAAIRALLAGPTIVRVENGRPIVLHTGLDPAVRDVEFGPEELLAALLRAQEVTREAVLAAGRAQAALEPVIRRTERDLAALRAEVEALGLDSVQADFMALDQNLVTLNARLATDPLGVSTSVEGTLRPQLEAIRTQIVGHVTARSRALASLSRAAERRKALAEVHATAREAALEGAREFSEGVVLPRPIDDGLLEGLGPWLANLEIMVQARRWQSAEIGLARWFETARRYFATDNAVKEAVAARLAARTELSGRLAAKRARAVALAARGAALDPSLEATAREAELLLARRPTPLHRAISLVEQYEAAVAHLAHGKRTP